jgi:oligopeptide/dipeptide ABC transporter ATP-binding protein
MSEPLIEAEDLTIQYRLEEGSYLTAVSDASFEIEEGEYFGLVGESGCGKSTLAKALIGGLDSNARIPSGTLRYKGDDLVQMSEQELRSEIRWNEISYIPQGSMNSLDPLQRVSDQAIEIAGAHTELEPEEALERFRELFGIVGIPTDRVRDYPHQFSGGMQQRVLIALALFLRPSLVIADEPTTALDVIMQDQVFKYLDSISEETEMSMVLISHDIGVVFESSQRVGVMHGGQIMEINEVPGLYHDPRHPYSILLQRAFPDINELDRELEIIEGEPPQLHGDVDYCTFIDRCPWATEECGLSAPGLRPVDDGDETHEAACFHLEDVADDIGVGTEVTER